MPTFTFWNTQNASTGDEGENKQDALITLSIHRDLIVLCEISGGTEAFWGNGVHGFTPVVPTNILGQYAQGTTYRYVIIYRAGTPAPTNAHLVNTGFPRPALYFHYLGATCLAIHAPSVTSSTGAQKSAIRTAFDTIANAGLARPMLVFGDLNVDALDLPMRNNFVNGTPGNVGVLPYYQARWPGTNLVPRDTAVATRPQSGKALDWLLQAMAFPNTTVTIFSIDLGAAPMDLDDDEPWGGHITNMTDRSDHHAIDISW